MKTKRVRPANLPSGADMEAAAQRLREISASLTIKKVGWDDRRSLTAEEWEEIKLLIGKFNFPCNLAGAAYGFIFRVHDHAPLPGITDTLLWADDGEFPFSPGKGFGGQIETLRVLAPITHNPRNAEVLAWYGFNPLSSRLETYTYC